MVNRSVDAVAAEVRDPELPQLTIADLGILRHTAARGDTAVVTITPTYTACPALETIRADLATALQSAGWLEVEIHTVFAPPWTTDWITPRGRQKLAEAGIAPPGEMYEQSAPPGEMYEQSAPPGAMNEQGAPPGAASEQSASPGEMNTSPAAAAAARPRRALPLAQPAVPHCPRCRSRDVEQLSRFGPTACLALWRCLACAEPFEHFKKH